MAKSGSTNKGFGSGHYIQIAWSATPNVGGNYSTITASVKLYRNFQWNSTAAKSGYLTINGARYNFSCTVGGSGGRLDTCYTVSRNISHDASGKLHLNITGSIDVAVTLSGVYYGAQTVSGQWDVDPIQRGIPITGWVGEPSGVKATFDSYPLFWTTGDQSPAELWLHVNGGGRIATGQPSPAGSTYGTIWASGLSPGTQYSFQLEAIKNGVATWSPIIYGSTLRPCDSCSMGSWFYVNHNLTVDITNPNKAYLQLYIYLSYPDKDGKMVESHQILSKPIGQINGSYTWTLTDEQRTTIYNCMKYCNEANAVLYINSFKDSAYTNQILHWQASARFTFKIDTSLCKPTLSNVNFTVAHPNNLTLPSSYLVQNQSTITISAPRSGMTTKNSADIKALLVTYGGYTERYTSAGNYNKTIAGLSEPGQYDISLCVEDTRGNKSASVTKQYTVLNYKAPMIQATVTRALATKGSVDVKLSATFSRLAVNSTDYNSMRSLKWGYGLMTETPSASNYLSGYSTSNDPNGIDKKVALSREGITSVDESKNYVFVFALTDKIQEYTVFVNLIDGDPIVRILETGHIGVGMKPDLSKPDKLVQISGGVDVNGSMNLVGKGQINLTGNLIVNGIEMIFT